MRTVKLFVVICSAYIASALPMEDVKAKVYPRYIDFPGGDGNMHKVDLEAEPDFAFLSTRENNENQYLLFTTRNPEVAQELFLDNADSIRNSNYDSSEQTIVIAHGWLSTRHTQPNPQIRDVYLAQSNVNIIVVDWSHTSQTVYNTAVAGVPGVGRELGRFIKFLVQTSGGSLNNFHLIGFSLGAHVVGNAGRELEGKIARITGLDPAGPLWNFNNDRLNKDDAIYVEGIHTDGSFTGLGIGSAIGDVDFFPNGGNSQPGCRTPRCHHERAWEFFVATVAHDNLVGNHCSSQLQVTMNRCTGSELHMGNTSLFKSRNGLYRVNTADTYPWNL